MEDIIKSLNDAGWLVDLYQHSSTEWEAIAHRDIVSPRFNKDQPDGVGGGTPSEALAGLRDSLASGDTL